jgi:hypothetical protein
MPDRADHDAAISVITMRGMCTVECPGAGDMHLVRTARSVAVRDQAARKREHHHQAQVRKEQPPAAKSGRLDAIHLPPHSAYANC